MNALKFVLMAVCFVSCGSSNNICNPREAKRVMENFAREYTGLDTLIRLDGYYYREENAELISPFMASNNGEFQIFHVRLKDHNQIQERFRNDKSYSRGRGNHILSGDTINVRWSLSYKYSCYTIFSEQYLILNDTTLRRIWSLCENCELSDGKKRDPARDEIYKFFKYHIDTK